MDGDSDLDIVIAFGVRQDFSPPELHHVAWYENMGGSWVPHPVGPVPTAIDADAGDFDNDGDMDIVAAGHDFGDRVRVFWRTAGGWEAEDLKTGWTAVNTVLAADLNGDGLTDIAAAADDGNFGPRREGGRKMRWWRQER